jgi:allophanate hydrolase
MGRTAGWTIGDWLNGYRTGAINPRDKLHELRASLRASDPAWIYIVSANELDQQLDQLAAADPFALPLFGVPFVVKDNIDAAGLPTTAGSPAFTYIAKKDAATVARLRAAGAVVIAKTNMDQFATGLVGTRSPFGAVPNSFDDKYISGGSSSGSAVAVARGVVPFSLGTDTAGSGRIPAGLNNIVGLKPTKGRFSTRGVVPACRSLDCVSIFSLTVDDADFVAELLEDFDPIDPYSRPAASNSPGLGESPTLAIPAALEWFGDEYAGAAWDNALDTMTVLGVRLVELDFSPMQALAELLYGGPWVAERHAAIADFMADKADQMNPVVRSIIEQAKQFTATEAFRAEYRRAELTRQIQTLMAGVSALLVPTAPRFPTIAQVDADPIAVNSQLGVWTNFVNLADCSAIALPAGFREDTLPFGITLIGSAWQDTALAEFGRRWSAAIPGPLGAINNNAKQPSAGADLQVLEKATHC